MSRKISFQNTYEHKNRKTKSSENANEKKKRYASKNERERERERDFRREKNLPNNAQMSQARQAREKALRLMLQSR
jgi:hypothetical protein